MASLTKSPTLLTPSDGFTARMIGTSLTGAIGAKSFFMSNFKFMKAALAAIADEVRKSV